MRTDPAVQDGRVGRIALAARRDHGRLETEGPRVGGVERGAIFIGHTTREDRGEGSMGSRAGLWLAAVCALVTAGCAAEEPQGSDVETTTTQAVTEAAASASPTPEGMNVQQVASVVAQQQASIDKLAADLEPCVFPEGAEAITGGFIAMRAPLEGQNMARDLAALDAPAELSSLLTDTIAAARALGAEDASACDQDPEGASCAGTSVRLRVSVESLQQVLAGWLPYQ